MNTDNLDLEKLYLSWYNDFLTVRSFAEHYDFTHNQALVIIDLGRKLNHKGSNRV